MNLLWVGLGGAAGVLLRALANTLIQSSFPFSTLIVNLLGSFLLGLLSTAPLKINRGVRLGMTTGMIGSFTTLSAVSAELFSFLQGEQYWFAIIYFLISLAGGFLFAYSGMKVGQKAGGDL
ncbi:fluoride efflux transporter FluC [Jeotgalibacillus haloalkalitolerans]|uniref:Fluoride-specific ion channel FluC n=1 Tax=Jeotgalibacillus haloalkalitolerans TaxID=3104292 RepID=A0ABU5KJC9_9BACL|nr:CrcB family protein [Jeotgalibacillus sp. HH7-29]MDZ5710835.1 CrcB family protein [Jeotgalibacillus sp. HH7-29]